MDTSRPRRYYILSDFGKGVVEEMSLEWLRIKTTVDQLLDKNMEKENETN
jgi:DNA-binding PadR family transcriptional regulator